MVSLKENSGALAILFIGIMLMSSFVVGLWGRGGFLGLTPISLYQGIHPSFEAVYFDNDYYTTEDPGDASTSRIGPATMNFDPDGPLTGASNLGGELRDIQIIRDLTYYLPGDTYRHIIADFGGTPQPDEPYRVYEWKIPEGEDTHVYRMELWLCSLQVNLWTQPDIRPWWALFTAYENHYRYSDTEIWLRLEASNDWGTYFEGVNLDNVYFGIAYIELAELEQNEDDTRLQVIPASQWTALDLYESIGGTPETVQSPTTQAYTYQGTELNQNVFKKEWYTKLTLQSFGAYDINIIDGSFKSDWAQWRILVHVFVVGDWLVKPDIERDIEDPDPPYYTGPLQGVVEALREFFNDPYWRLKLALIVTVFIVVWVLLFFPWIPATVGRLASNRGERKT